MCPTAEVLRGKRKHPDGFHRPVLVELNCEVGHVLQGLVGEAHVHVHVTLAAGEGARDLQTLRFDRREPHLVKNEPV